MTGKIPVTVVVPVRNEAGNIAKCLSRLKPFAEVVVIDSASTDGTREIVREAGVRLVDFSWNGSYPKKRNWYLLNDEPSCPWVLFLDADEFVDQAFCSAVGQAIRSTEYDGYWLTYTNHFLGRRLRFGVPQRKLALFRVGKGLYERVEEESWSGLDMEVHEHPVIDGAVGEISVPIEHNDDRGIDHFIDRHRDYARWESRRLDALGPSQKCLTRRQRFKYRHLASWWFPWFYFFYAYLVRLGCLDGGAGFLHAFYKAWYFQTIRLLVRERRRADRMAVR